ncbi:hypothetical protein PMAYCL1PPCAC_17681, partial [Pristionchus mayeri]
MHNEDKSISSRPKWNLSMLSKSMMTRLLAGYLTCHCGFEYNSEKSEVKPVMLGCNHIVCSRCSNPNFLDRLCMATPRCPICHARILWKSDPLSDIEFASFRDKKLHSKCEVCHKLYPADRSRVCSKKFRDKETGEIKECPNMICFDCIRTAISLLISMAQQLDLVTSVGMPDQFTFYTVKITAISSFAWTFAALPAMVGSYAMLHHLSAFISSSTFTSLLRSLRDRLRVCIIEFVRVKSGYGRKITVIIQSLS